MDGNRLTSRALSASRIQNVVRSAARRKFALTAIEQLAFALAPVLAGFVLLLLAGTQILHWYWLALLALAGSAVAIVRIRARALSHYETAQLLDKRLHLDDSLSTAWFLLERHGEPTGIAGFQVQQAQEIAADVEPARAFPFAWQRAWALTAALAAVAFALFAVRYLVTKSLSLEQSLIPVQITPVFERLGNQLFARNRMWPDVGADRSQFDGDQNAGQTPDHKTTGIPQQQGQPSGEATDPNGKAATQAASDQNGKLQNSDAENRDGDSPNSPADGKQSQSGKNAASKHEMNGGQQGAQGLMDKMKDALSSLMAKMRQSSTPQSQPNNRQSEEDKAASQNGGKAQQSNQQDARNQQSGQDESSESEAQAQASERPQQQSVQGRSSDSRPDKGADAHSGIGRQDGDKALKEAAQLQAMGKLAEIIGQRSASLTGDMMVETGSSKQQLKTAYTGKLGRHSDAGGEINRDEIPLADQQYVRTYMELVRKQSKTEK